MQSLHNSSVKCLQRHFDAECHEVLPYCCCCLQAVFLPTIGVSSLFPMDVVMREVAALASHCDDVIPSVRKIIICTNKESTLNEYRQLFSSSEWKGMMQENQIFDTCK